MKTQIISFLAIVLTATLSAQVQLEHTYNFSGTITELSENEYKYFVMDVPLKQCRIYDEDHSLYKTINLGVPSGYYLHDVKFVTRHLFNADDNIELLYIYAKTGLVNTEEVYYYGMKVVSETGGGALMSLTDGGYAEIRETSEGYKLLAYQYIYFEGYYLVYTNVYSLGGTTKALEAETSAMKLFPNPASDMLTVQFDPEQLASARSLKLVDIQGKTITTKTLQPGTDMTRISVGSLPPGTYIMSLNNEQQPIQSVTFEKH
jgi:hypothetical protein